MSDRLVSYYYYYLVLSFVSGVLISDRILNKRFFIDHAKGSHGMPGLYFKYDVSALKVIVKPDQEGFMHFLIRISSVIAGIIVISGKKR